MDTRQQAVRADSFQFDELTHTYFLGDLVIPGIHEVLEFSGIVDQGVNYQALARGKAVHAACHYLDENDLDWKSLSDELIPYVLAYEKFLKDMKPVWRYVEKRLVNTDLAYACTIDREGLLGKTPSVVEIKTGSYRGWYDLQTSAQDMALPRLTRQRERYVLLLRKDATYDLKPCRDQQDYAIWQALIATFWYRKNRNI